MRQIARNGVNKQRFAYKSGRAAAAAERCAGHAPTGWGVIKAGQSEGARPPNRRKAAAAAAEAMPAPKAAALTAVVESGPPATSCTDRGEAAWGARGPAKSTGTPSPPFQTGRPAPRRPRQEPPAHPNPEAKEGGSYERRRARARAQSHRPAIHQRAWTSAPRTRAAAFDPHLNDPGGAEH